MTILQAATLFLAALAVGLSVAALSRASQRYTSLKYAGKIRNLQLEVAELADAFERVSHAQKRMTARLNMREHRERKKQNGADMTDEEWRKWATKRVQQGLDVT